MTGDIKEKGKEIYSKMIKGEHEKLVLLVDYEKMQETIDELRQENEELKRIINNIADYVNKMGFGSIVDNPKKDLTRILDKEK